MNNFDTLFPNFLSQCAEMNRVLTPIAFVLLAIGIVSSTVTGHRSPSAYLRTIGRTFAFAAVLAYLPTWNNEIASVVDTTVKQTLRAGARAACAFAYGESLLILSVNTGRIGSQGLFNRCVDNARNLVVPSRQISQHGRESKGASNRAQISARTAVARNRR